MQRRRRRHHRSLGQSLAEFALVLPIFLLILTGIIDFGFMLYSRMTVINATREGARAAVTMIKNFQGIPATVQNAVVGADTGLGLTTGNVTVSCVPIGSNGNVDGSASCSFSSNTQAPTGDFNAALVTTNYTYHSIFASFFGSTITLTSSVQMIIDPQ